MTKPTTFYEFLKDNIAGANMDPRFQRNYFEADYTLPNSAFRDVEHIGKAAKVIAIQKGIDLMQFPEVQKAMTYDGNGWDLSDAEMGSLILAAQLATNTYMNRYDEAGVKRQLTSVGTSELNEFSMDSELTMEIGREVYSDNKEGNKPGIPEELATAAIVNNLTGGTT